jgi:mono/diheme cytochrome c family protein
VVDAASVNREELAMSRTHIILLCGACALVGGSALVGGHSILPSAKAQQTSQATNGLFQQAQAEQGHQLFNNYCAQCHRPDLTGAQGPALKGSAFSSKWTGKPLSALYNFEHSQMPANAPGSLPDSTMLPITAYILQQNGYAAGSAPLDQAALAKSLPKP